MGEFARHSTRALAESRMHNTQYEQESTSVHSNQRPLVSDADHQLIFKFVFKETVALSAIAISADQPPKAEAQLSTSDTAGTDTCTTGTDTCTTGTDTCTTGTDACTTSTDTCTTSTDDSPPITSNENDCELESSAPRILKCYSNREGFDFYEVDSSDADQVIELTNDLLTGMKISLKGSRFCRCQTVQFFVDDNYGDCDRTFVNQLKLYGHVVPQ
eukprot:Lankesteria_metandrocarpae@DN2468_c0_g1_i3.p1